MYLWSKYKFLFIFLALIFGVPFLVLKFSNQLFFSQEASSLYSGVSPCLANNPPSLWVEKDKNSRKGYVPSGILNTPILSFDLINCGEVKIKEIIFKISGTQDDLILEEGFFRLMLVERKVYFEGEKSLVKDGVQIRFDLESLNLTSENQLTKIDLLGFLPEIYGGKTNFVLDRVFLDSSDNSNVILNDVSSRLIFLKKQ